MGTFTHRITAGLVLPAALVATAIGAPAAHAAAGDGDGIAARKRAAAAGTIPLPDAAATARRHAPAPAGSTVDLIVGLTGDAVSAKKVGGFSARSNTALARIGVRTVSVPRAEAAEAAAKLRTTPGVAYVEEDATVTADAVTPNDPQYPRQTDLRQIGVPDAWSSTTGSGITVAVIDSGVTPFDDLSGRVLSGYDFVNGDDEPIDDDGHGTAVASLIAGRGNDGQGMAGLCWSCSILPVKVLDHRGDGLQSTVASGVIYAADLGAKIINMSLGGPGDVRALRDAVAYAQRKGALVVASAGNDAVSTPQYPAAYPGVLSIGGTAPDGEWALYETEEGEIVGSNFGAGWVDVAAPFCTWAAELSGLSTADPADDYDDFCGTSASAPLVAGVLALEKSKHPRASNAALTYSLTRTARQSVQYKFTQFGEIRAGRAVASVDTAAPRITGAAPAQNKRFRGAVTVTATGVSDSGTGLSHALLYANGRYVGRDNTAPYALRYSSGTFNGNVNLQWRVYDKAGNYGVYNRRIIADNKAPAAKITSAPKNGKKVKGTVTLKAAASDASGVARVELIINGKVVAKDYKAGYAFKIKVKKYGKKLKVQVRAVDKVGNTRTTAARTWKR
ncbi:putative subtilase-family protease [Actinoplanes missouriensis 431]|uniref:Putative subtilase-family protease n=1 Tax=Actinoplanes missouriensis (strain ATCC 14538 / DSM 43046 / CBS 188.64 / JCM 3121 / NBRC 102363 / NCIMB 12654 / NRRL B-3342 / UNCC 431) TaxID=512565 RepID=I0H2C0_ACTM4|nr:S8 family serine peptidase [Actinoplanes missouriensis]BAL87157.1 putative subtilase-family protease [Actinoplanes missouriensis 431]